MRSTFIYTIIDIFSKYFVLHNKTKNVNPLTRIHISNKGINDIKFSPNGRLLAVASEDGYLYVIDYPTSK
jgi:WD40 repeat protein